MMIILRNTNALHNLGDANLSVSVKFRGDALLRRIRKSYRFLRLLWFYESRRRTAGSSKGRTCKSRLIPVAA